MVSCLKASLESDATAIDAGKVECSVQVRCLARPVRQDAFPATALDAMEPNEHTQVSCCLQPGVY